MEKTPVLVGDATEYLDAMYSIHRLREVGYWIDIAASTRREVKLVVHDLEEGRDIVDGNVVSRTGRTFPSGRAPSSGCWSGRRRPKPGDFGGQNRFSYGGASAAQCRVPRG